MTRYVYVGTSTQGIQPQEPTRGILVFQMDLETGALAQVQEIESGPEPSFLALHPNQRALFAVNETSQGAASAFALDPASGKLTFLNRASLGSSGPCYVNISPDGSWLVTANYSGGSLSILPVDTDGRLGALSQVVKHQGSSAGSSGSYLVRDRSGVLAEIEKPLDRAGVLPDRQEQAHAHCAIFDPSYTWLLAADLGMDRVWVYRFDQDTGRILPAAPGSQAGFATRPGAGPRHLAFHPNGRILFVSNELNSTVLGLAWDGESGRLELLQEESTLPADFQAESWAADLHLTPDGRFLYVSNRGHDSLACFQVNADSGKLALAGFYPTLGSYPRNFGITPDGKFLLAANQKGGTIVVFRLDADTGALEQCGLAVTVNDPMFACAVDFP